MATSPSTLSLLRFNGQNVLIDCGELDLNNTSFTIEFWAKRNGKGAWHIAVQQGKNGNHQCLHLGFRDNNVFTLAFHGDDLNTRKTYVDGAWHHWSCVYNRDRKRQEVFCDGKSVAARNCSNLKSNNKFYIGCYEGKSFFFDGSIAEVRLWKTVRTAADVQRDMNIQLTGQEVGLLAYWPLDDGKGAVARDVTGNGHDGTIHYQGWQDVEVPFQPRSAEAIPSLMFNGKSDYIKIPNSSSLQTQTYTLELWFKTAGALNGWIGVAGKPGRGHHIWLINQRVFHIFHTAQDTNHHTDPPQNLFPWGQWTHVAITNDGTTGKTYVNGQLKAECPNNAGLVVDKTPLYIGGNLDGEGTSCFFTGEMAEVRLWSAARSPQEIQQHMQQQLVGNEAGLSGYWPLDEGSGSVAHDKTANQNHGTIHGGNWQTIDVPFQPRPIQEENSQPMKSNSALNFANTKNPSDYVLVKPFSPSPTHAFTIEFWVKVAKKGRDRGVPFALSAPQRANEFVFFNCKKIEFYIHDSQHQAGSASLTKGKWQHCAVTWESKTGQMHLYIDGQAKFDPVLAKGLTLDQTTIVVLGQDPDNYGGGFDVNQAFQGQMKEVRIWNTVRTPEEIKAQMHQCCTGKEAGLVGYWPLDEGEGNIVNDKTSNGNNGELHGATWKTAEGLDLAPIQTAPASTQANLAPTQTSKSGSYIPAAQPKTMTVGLEDYAYWWQEVAKEQAEAKERPKNFRRGRIWS